MDSIATISRFVKYLRGYFRPFLTIARNVRFAGIGSLGQDAQRRVTGGLREGYGYGLLHIITGRLKDTKKLSLINITLGR